MAAGLSAVALPSLHLVTEPHSTAHSLGLLPAMSCQPCVASRRQWVCRLWPNCWPLLASPCNHGTCLTLYCSSRSLLARESLMGNPYSNSEFPPRKCNNCSVLAKNMWVLPRGSAELAVSWTGRLAVFGVSEVLFRDSQNFLTTLPHNC